MDTALHRLRTLFYRCDKPHSPWKKNKSGEYPSLNTSNKLTIKMTQLIDSTKGVFLLFDICPLNFFHYMYFRKPIVVHSATGETKSISSQFKSINQFVRLRIIRILWTFYKAFKIMNLNLGIGNTIKRRRTPDLHFLIWKNLLFFLCNVPINNNLYIRYSFYTNS